MYASAPSTPRMMVAAVLRDGRGSQRDQAAGCVGDGLPWRPSSGTAEDRNRIFEIVRSHTVRWRPSSGTAEDRNVSYHGTQWRPGDVAAVLRDGRGSQLVQVHVRLLIPVRVETVLKGWPRIATDDGLCVAGWELLRDCTRRCWAFLLFLSVGPSTLPEEF